MENYNSFSKQPQRHISTLALGFVILQFIFIGAILVSIFGGLKSDIVSDDDLVAQPHITISNLDSVVSGLPDSSSTIIEYGLTEIVKNNLTEFNTDTIAELRVDSVKTEYFPHQKINYLSAIVDLPELRQSYRIFHEYSEDKSNPYLSPNSSIIALCLGDEEEKFYSDFNCKDIYDQKTRSAVVANYLDYFDFDYFSAYLNLDDPDTVIISPAVTYDNDEVTKTRYINEVKAAIESLGLSPDSFEYYVRTAADVNYDNSD